MLTFHFQVIVIYHEDCWQTIFDQLHSLQTGYAIQDPTQHSGILSKRSEFAQFQ